LKGQREARAKGGMAEHTTTTKLYPTKWGRLHGSNYAIMFYHKPYFGPRLNIKNIDIFWSKAEHKNIKCVFPNLAAAQNSICYIHDRRPFCT